MTGLPAVEGGTEERLRLDRTWTPKPGDRVVRHPRRAEMEPVHVHVTARKVPSRALASPLILIYAFAALIALGTALLLLPFAHHGDGFTPFMAALFTAASAVTVTGLVVEETAVYWTRTGQVFILGLMFVGGLGFMSIATFLVILIGHRISLAHSLLVRESLGVNQLGGLVRLTVYIVLFAAGIQALGFVALFARFSFDHGPAEAVWQAAFHAVSGFNNAGFIALTQEEGLAAYTTDGAILGIIAALCLIGAISFWVVVDIVRFRRFALFSLTTKLVLTFTAVLILVGALAFFGFEYENPATIGQMSLKDKIVSSIFHSVTGRTAGFATADFGATEQQTNLFFSALMFIGGASASVAGGIKINTFAVVVIAVLSTIRGRSHVSAFGRELRQTQVQRSMVIGTVAIAFVFLVATALTFSEDGGDFIALFFESVSSFGTVGLSTGLTPDLSSWGHVILVISMFVGRIGPLTLGLAMAQRTETDPYRFPEERVTIG